MGWVAPGAVASVQSTVGAINRSSHQHIPAVVFSPRRSACPELPYEANAPSVPRDQLKNTDEQPLGCRRVFSPHPARGQ